MTLAIRDGDAGSLDQVMAVMDGAFGDTFGEAWTRSQCAGILPMDGVALILAREGEALSGFALYRIVLDDAELLLLAVAPERQRGGIGRALLERFIADARAKGAANIHLEVRDGNGATRMYEAAGFAPAGRRRDYYRGADGRRHDALTFVLAT